MFETVLFCEFCLEKILKSFKMDDIVKLEVLSNHVNIPKKKVLFEF